DLLCARCLAKAPKRRPAAAAVARELEAILDGRARDAGSRAPVAVLVAGAVFAATVVLAVGFLARFRAGPGRVEPKELVRAEAPAAVDTALAALEALRGEVARHRDARPLEEALRLERLAAGEEPGAATD